MTHEVKTFGRGFMYIKSEFNVTLCRKFRAREVIKKI